MASVLFLLAGASAAGQTAIVGDDSAGRTAAEIEWRRRIALGRTQRQVGQAQWVLRGPVDRVNVDSMVVLRDLQRRISTAVDNQWSLRTIETAALASWNRRMLDVLPPASTWDPLTLNQRALDALRANVLDMAWRNQRVLDILRTGAQDLAWRNQRVRDSLSAGMLSAGWPNRLIAGGSVNPNAFWRNQRLLDDLRSDAREMAWRNQRMLESVRSSTQDLISRNQRMLEQLRIRQQDLAWFSRIQQALAIDSARELMWVYGVEAWAATSRAAMLTAVNAGAPDRYVWLVDRGMELESLTSAGAGIRRVPGGRMGGWGIRDYTPIRSLQSLLRDSWNVGTYRRFLSGTYIYRTTAGVTTMQRLRP